MKGGLVSFALLLALIGANAQAQQGTFDPTNRDAVLQSAREWASQKNAESNETPMQNALKNAGKIMNAANAQINAQKDDPNATPETVAAGAAYTLTGQEPTQTAVVLSAAKEGLSNAVAGLPQLIQNFQQARQNPLPEQPGPQDLLKGLQSLMGGQDTNIQTGPNKQFYRASTSASADALTSQVSSDQARILTGQARLLDPGDIHTHDMFPAGERWVGRAEGSAPPGFNASYIAAAPSAGDNALSPAALAKALLYSNPDIVPGSTAFPGKGNADALAQVGAMNDLGTGPAPKAGGGHFEPLQNSFGATLDPSNPGMLSTNRNVLPGSSSGGSNVPGGFQSYAQMKPATAGLGIPNTLPTTTVLKTELGPDKLPISMSFGRKLLS